MMAAAIATVAATSDGVSEVTAAAARVSRPRRSLPNDGGDDRAAAMRYAAAR